MFDFLNGLFGGLFWQINSLFGSMFSTVGSFFANITAYLGNVLSSFFNAIVVFLNTLFKPILDFFDAILYLFQQAFILAVLVLKVIAALFGLIVSLGAGLINTIVGFTTWSGSTQYYSMPDPLQQGVIAVTGLLNQTGFESLPLVLAVFIWIMTAMGVIKIIGGRN